MKRKTLDGVNDIIQGIISSILVERPCKIVKINSQYSVDIEVFNDNGSDILYKVPVKNFQTQNAYFYLKLNVGDRGTVRFLDNNFLNYFKNSPNYSEVIYPNHNVQNGIFVLGFFPENEEYEIASGEIAIGTKNGCAITISNDEIKISGGKIILNGDTTICGKNFLTHTHSNGNNGNATGGVL